MKIPFSAIVLDMNGVIVQSNNIKHAAMLDLFAKWPSIRPPSRSTNRGSGGIPRKVKFRHIREQILGLPYDRDVESALAKEYELTLADVLLETPIVEGVDHLITNVEVPIYMCSAAPPEEARRRLDYRHFAPYVTAVFGDPVGKADAALRQVVVESGFHARDIVFFADSLTDHDAAVEVGVIIREKNEFVEVDCLKIVDFRNWHAAHGAEC